MENSQWITFEDNIIAGWIGEHYYLDAVEKYVELYPEKCIIIDIFPKPILDTEKYYQVAIFYRKWVDGNIDNKTFLDNERKYLSFVKTLWLYNKVDVYYDLYFNNYFRKGIKRHIKYIKRSSKKNTLYNVQDWNMLEELLRYALREAGFLCIYFKQWDIIALINDFTIQLLFKNNLTIQRILPMIEKNLLYVQSKENHN